MTKMKAASAERFCEMLAACFWGPKTRQQLIEYTGSSETAVERWIAAAVQSGLLVEVAPLPVTGRGNRPTVAYQHCLRQPFAGPDQSHPS